LRAFARLGIVVRVAISVIVAEILAVGMFFVHIHTPPTQVALPLFFSGPSGLVAIRMAWLVGVFLLWPIVFVRFVEMRTRALRS